MVEEMLLALLVLGSLKTKKTVYGSNISNKVNEVE